MAQKIWERCHRVQRSLNLGLSKGTTVYQDNDRVSEEEEGRNHLMGKGTVCAQTKKGTARSDYK